MPSSDLSDALEAQAIRNERTLSLGALVLGLTGIVSVLFAMATSVPDSVLRAVLGPRIIALVAAMVLWHTFAFLLLSRKRGGRTLPWVSAIIEAVFPVAVMWVGAISISPRYAAVGSPGPMLFAVMCILTSMRLRWQIPLVAGLIGAAVYAVFTWTVLIPGFEDGEAMPGLSARGMFAQRPLLVAAFAVVLALINYRLRLNMKAVHGQLRSKELFGKYRLGKVIAAGGMGEVVRATYCPEGGFEKPVAIKRINSWLVNDTYFIDAFRREAELCSHLTHANIVQVLDFGQEGGSYFLAMEYVEGVTLQALMAWCRASQAPIPSSLVAELGRRIAAALHFAHREARDANGKRLHVIHRDLSPSNVLISRAGEVKVTDFGIAKVLGDKETTRTENVTGKPAYMAPEQASAEALDERVDLFALGIVLWELLSLSRLFASDTDAATLLKLMTLPVPPISKLRPELASTGWDAFLSRALARPREERFQSAEELGLALGEVEQLPDEGSAHGALAELVARVQASPPAQLTWVPVAPTVDPDAVTIRR